MAKLDVKTDAKTDETSVIKKTKLAGVVAKEGESRYEISTCKDGVCSLPKVVDVGYFERGLNQPLLDHQNIPDVPVKDGFSLFGGRRRRRRRTKRRGRRTKHKRRRTKRRGRRTRSRRRRRR